jgi:hypothetical protein
VRHKVPNLLAKFAVPSTFNDLGVLALWLELVDHNVDELCHVDLTAGRGSSGSQGRDYQVLFPNSTIRHFSLSFDTLVDRALR